MNVRSTLTPLLATLTAVANAQLGWNDSRTDDVQVTYQNRRVDFSRDDEPFTRGSTVMLPLRRTAQAVGARLETEDRDRWRDTRGDRNDRYSRDAYELTWRGNRIRYRAGESFYTLDGRRRDLGAASIERRDRLFVPAEIFIQLTDRDLRVRRDRDGGGGWNDGRGLDLQWRGRTLRFDRLDQPFRDGRTVYVPFRALGEALELNPYRLNEDRWNSRGGGNRRVEDDEKDLRDLSRDGGWNQGRGDFRTRVCGLDSRRGRLLHVVGERWYRWNGQRRSLNADSRERNGIVFVPFEMFRAVAGNDLRLTGDDRENDGDYGRWNDDGN